VTGDENDPTLRADHTLPTDPMSTLAAGAAQMHEMFMSYVDAGFARSEALQIIIGIMTAGIRPPGSEE
jgi:hypothetical protein